MIAFRVFLNWILFSVVFFLLISSIVCWGWLLWKTWITGGPFAAAGVIAMTLSALLVSSATDQEGKLEM